jgi:hypothetical protein
MRRRRICCDRSTGLSRPAINPVNSVSLIEKTRIYPLSQKDNPPTMAFPNASGVPINMLFPSDVTYFETLRNSSTMSQPHLKILQCEAWPQTP